MDQTESSDPQALFFDALAEARQRIEPPVRRERAWPAVAAAAFFAVSAMVFATAAILAPPAHLTPISITHNGD
jgi:hypothetical protein